MKWRFPEDVDGWLSENEGRALAMFALGCDVLEVGSYCGRSTICMAQVANSVVSVDPHTGDATPVPKDTLAAFLENLKRYGVNQAVSFCRSTIAGVDFGDLTFDLAFIDGAHDLESVRMDISHALRLLRPGGMLAFHDYRWGTPGQGYDAGVEQAVNELLASGAKMVFRAGSVAVVTPPVPAVYPAAPAA